MRKKHLSFFVLIVCLYSFGTLAQEIPVDGSSAVDFLLSNQKPNGAFGPSNKEYTDLAWTYPAVHALKLLKAVVPREEAAFDEGHQAWIEKAPWKNGPWYWSFYQKARLYSLYNKKDRFEDDISFGQDWTLSYAPRTNYTEFRKYPQGEFFDMSSLWHLVGGIDLLEGRVTNPGDVVEYIEKRWSGKGGFVDDVNVNPELATDKAHLVITYNAVMTLRSLGMPISNPSLIIDWIQSCQTPSGGFKWNPVSTEHSNKEDVWYTWAAILTLKELGSEPNELERCIEWVNSLQNADGGFGDRPGWTSRIYSTYYAVHALDILTGDAKDGISLKLLPVQEEIIPEGKYSIFQAHHKSPTGGKGMVDSVFAMKLNLIAVKSNEFDVVKHEGMTPSLEKARAYAEEKGYPLEIVESPENYSHNVHWISGQKADHVSNFMLPPNLSKKDGAIYKAAFQFAQEGLTWKDFKQKVIAPVQGLGAGTLFYPELDYTMVNAYMVYDDGLDGMPGYNAVPAAHFGNIDWVRHFPYKERWEGVLPMIADGDAHGDIVKWASNLGLYRNVFIAEGSTYEDYLDASANGRSVCVIRMPDTNELRYYGATSAIAYLKKHIAVWHWWE